jgi:hypothetical protein
MTVYNYTDHVVGPPTFVNNILDGSANATLVGHVDPNDGPFVLISRDASASIEIDIPYDNLYGLSLSSSQPSPNTITQDNVEYYMYAYDIVDSEIRTINGSKGVLFRIDTQSA